MSIPNASKYVIIGAGIHGLSTAYHLALELKKRNLGGGEDILVIDKSGIGSGAVPSALHDAGSMSGVTRIQRLLKIEFPLAFPHIMLGLNQTVVFALFMVIIGAFIGTEDLGQYIMKALSDLKGGGKGLILGLCVAFIGLAVDNLIRTWAERRKQLLGLS